MMRIQTYDAIIIGAGLSGLQAARTLEAANLSYLILEARDRIGGKTLSTPRPDGKGKQELGAAWINDTNQSQMWALAQQFGMTSEKDGLVVQNTSGDVVVHDFPSTGKAGGSRIVRFPYGEVPEYADREDSEDCVRIRDLVESTSLDASMFESGSLQRTKLDSMSFEGWLHENKAGAKARATAQVWTHAMVGVDPGEVSALYFLEYCRCGGGLMTMRSDCKDGGQYLRFKMGTSSFSTGLSAQLKDGSVQLNQVVVAVEQEGDEVTVKTAGGESFRAKKVICSIPTPVYKSIAWSPPLPNGKMSLARQTRYGCYTKYMVLFKRPFWRDAGFCGLSQSFLGPISVTRDTSVDDEGNYAMTCFIGGVFARKWSALPEEQKLSTVLKQIGEMFAGGQDIRHEYVDTMESPWMGEEWSGWGCPCPVMPPGVLDKGFEELCRPFDNLHFVGTESANVWRGYMEGAIRSGERGAEEVITALGKKDSTKVNGST